MPLSSQTLCFLFVSYRKAEMLAGDNTFVILPRLSSTACTFLPVPSRVETQLGKDGLVQVAYRHCTVHGFRLYFAAVQHCLTRYGHSSDGSLHLCACAISPYLLCRVVLLGRQYREVVLSWVILRNAP